MSNCCAHVDSWNKHNSVAQNEDKRMLQYAINLGGRVCLADCSDLCMVIGDKRLLENFEHTCRKLAVVSAWSEAQDLVVKYWGILPHQGKAIIQIFIIINFIMQFKNNNTTILQKWIEVITNLIITLQLC